MEKGRGEPNCGEEEKKKGGEGRVLEEIKEGAKNLREKFEKGKKYRRRKRRREGEIKEEMKKV